MWFYAKPFLFVTYILAIAFGAPLLPAWGWAIIVLLWIPAGLLNIYIVAGYVKKPNPFDKWPDQLVVAALLLGGCIGLAVVPLYLKLIKPAARLKGRLCILKG